MRYIVAIEFTDYFRVIARTSSLETAKLVQIALERLFGLKAIVVDTRGL